jgi:hypothetical protein
MLFGERTNIDHSPVVLPTASDVRQLIKHSTTGENFHNIEFRFMFDPIAPDVGEYVVCDRDALIEALATSTTPL